MNCPHCGVTLKDEHPKFCSSCGMPIPQAVPRGPGILAPGQEEVLYEGRPAAVQSLGGFVLAVLTLGLSWLVMWLRMRGTKVRITSQRIIVERGLLSPRLEQVDLYRIVDYVVERPFFQRIMGTGNITFETLDKTQPKVRITGIRTDVVALYERIRAATEAEKRRRGVALVDMEHQ
jgi:hypothetical protein